MEPNNQWRHQLIERLMAQHTEKVVVAAIDLWELLARQIVILVGEGGFNALYARSVLIAQSTFPWLAACSLPRHADQRFGELKTSLEGQIPVQASAANGLLLITFTDILAALIGEQLTASILHSAWGSNASYSAGKEFKNG
ncbi:MAG: hypothetical protein ACYDHM_10980 [Acidiferrobacterales bacterium]